MKELKIRTHGNENLSKAIQDELKKMGYVNNGTGEYRYTSAPYLYAHESGHTGHCSCTSFFNNHENKEVTIYDLIEMNAQDDTKQEEIRAIRKEMEVLAARLKEAEK